MQIKRIITVLAITLISQIADAQTIIKGLVVDADTNEPVIGATISNAKNGKPLTVTNADGRFQIPRNNEIKLKISYIGYKTLITAPTKDGRYLMQAEISRLGEVVVTAQESRGLTSSSVIQKHAMEHLQPSSFADILELLPGGRAQTPSLSTPNVIHIREADSGGSQYMTSSLGTQFMVDGAPISTNANMQYVSGAWDTESTYRDFTNAGVDMRSLSTDDIEKVEVIRGIPSVEYGDLTSGLVKIERKKGGHDMRLRLKADMSSKLFYISKGFEWKPKHLSLNLSADYLDSKADPRNTLENYKRVTLSARLHKQWLHNNYDMTLSTNVDYTGSFDNDKVDPDLNYSVEDSYRSQYNRIAWMGDLTLKTKNNSWLKSAGREMKQVVREVTLLEDGEIRTLTGEEMQFGYRTSYMKSHEGAVLGAVMDLKEGDPAAITERIRELAVKRREKQPLEYASAGSTFKRPAIPGVYAGRLIQDAGLRGYACGDAQVSEKHCGFVINRGGASAAQIRRVIEDVRERVFENSGIRLEREVIYLGEF